MESLEKINRKILLITSQIKEDHPELLTFLNEMPITIPDTKSPELNLKTLGDYYTSLVLLKEKYLQQINLKKHD
jgi:hypothetical protein